VSDSRAMAGVTFVMSATVTAGGVGVAILPLVDPLTMPDGSGPPWWVAPLLVVVGVVVVALGVGLAGMGVGEWRRARYIRRPEPDPTRCDYRSPLERYRCVMPRGHDGVCVTAARRTDGYGRSWVVSRKWYGVNYRWSDEAR
jgi:hypothetical protein